MNLAVSVALQDFVTRYGAVYEHSPWVAEQCFVQACDVHDPAKLAEIFAACVDSVDKETKLALIRAHPDLAGRAAVAGELTAESSDEQASAGIDQCTPQEFQRFQEYNARYKEKFGFPFIMAVRQRRRDEILAAFERRLKHSPDQEFDQAMVEIHKIARLRLAKMSEESSGK